MAVKVRESRGAWWVVIDWKGRRKSKRVGVGKAGKRAAEAVAEQIQAKLALGDLSPLEGTPPPAVTFREYAEGWLAMSGVLGRKPSTALRYRQILRAHWDAPLGALPLRAITRDRIKALIKAKLDQGIAPSSLHRAILPPLQACLQSAVEDGHIPISPLVRVGKFVCAGATKAEQLDVFTREELAQLLQTAQADFPEYYPAFLTLARTGMRIGELIGLKPEDLDFRERAILIRRAVYKGRVQTPKNGKGRRVDMSDQLAGVLQDYLTLRQAEAAVEGRAPSPWLFPGHRGGLLNYDHFTERVWAPLLRRAGLRHRGLHQLRHTFASFLIQNGESLAYVRDQLGHHSIKLTVDTYGHLIPGANRQAVNRLDDAAGRNLPATAPAVAIESD